MAYQTSMGIGTDRRAGAFSSTGAGLVIESERRMKIYENRIKEDVEM